MLAYSTDWYGPVNYENDAPIATDQHYCTQRLQEFDVVFVPVRGWVIVVNHEYYSRVNYCPYCGVKLEDRCPHCGIVNV